MRHTVERDTELIEVLQGLHPGAARNTLRRMLDTGRVRVDGALERRAKRVVPAGAVVEIGVKRTGPADADDLGGGARVLLEDDLLIVAEKPQGMLTIATDRGDRDTLYDRLFERAKRVQRGGRVFIVHRLDRPTSGLVLFAKAEEVKERLQAAFAAGEVERVYHVLVEGLIAEESGTVEARLATSDSLQVYVTPSERHGAAAVTHWRVIGRGRRDTLLEVRLGTGKRHQIRVHMAHLGHPVVGDKEHGAKSDPLRRLGLHAHRLSFPHPRTGLRIDVTSRTPPSFHKLLKRLPHEDKEPDGPGAAQDGSAGRS